MGKKDFKMNAANIKGVASTEVLGCISYLCVKNQVRLYTWNNRFHEWFYHMLLVIYSYFKLMWGMTLSLVKFENDNLREKGNPNLAYLEEFRFLFTLSQTLHFPFLKKIAGL